MLADALPDDFGNALIDAWMAQKGIDKSSITVLDPLAYMRQRGMGALEFRPAWGSHKESTAPIAMKQLVEEARRLVQGNFSADNQAKTALANIIRVGVSAAGARAKAVIAWNPKSDEVRSGQFDAVPGFEHWLLKFDGSEKTGNWEPGKDTDVSNMPIRSWRKRQELRCLLRYVEADDTSKLISDAAHAQGCDGADRRCARACRRG
jgi:hypothetical protein